MNFDHTTNGGILIITPIEDSLDAGGAPAFKEQVLNLVNSNNTSKVILDLNKLHFIDSSGLGCFLSVFRTLNSRGGDLRLSQITNPIKTMFELVKMQKMFKIYPSTNDAVKSFDSESN